MPKKKEEEVEVDAPKVIKEERLLKDTTGIEAFEVFKKSMKIGKLLSNFMIVIGAVLSIFSLYNLLVTTQFKFNNPILIGVFGLIGAINIFCGLIMLAKE